MRRPLVAAALALTVILSGSEFLANPFLPLAALAADTPRPMECPKKVGKLPFDRALASPVGRPPWLQCHYVSPKKARPDYAIAKVQWVESGSDVVQSETYTRLHCQVGDDAEAGRPVDRFGRGKIGSEYSLVGEKYVLATWHSGGDKSTKWAKKLAKDLVAKIEPRAAFCPGAEPAGPSAEEPEAPEAALDAPTEAYLALAADYDAREGEIEVMENAAGFDVDLQSEAWAELAAAAEALAAGVKGLPLPASVKVEAEALIATAQEQARLWRLMAGDLSPTDLEDAGFDDALAVEEAAFAAISARQKAQATLQRALALPPAGQDPGGNQDEDAPSAEDAGVN